MKEPIVNRDWSGSLGGTKISEAMVKIGRSGDKPYQENDCLVGVVKGAELERQLEDSTSRLSKGSKRFLYANAHCSTIL